ncbi:MAG TPA: hypothetical protein VNU97_05910 [Rhizomicrobium sp.]|jgi:hypothetical protein|nr:hypothetical protein [Rhizomicrobium sp.]
MKDDSALPRIKSVQAARAPLLLDVVWGDGTKSRIDMTGLVHSSRHFKVFAQDAAAFRRVKPVGYGSGIGWENGLDYSAATLRTLAQQQQALSGRHLAKFEARHGLNTAETAALFDVAERTVRSYRETKALPEPVAIALRTFDSDPTVFAAHYRPVARRGRGRPAKVAAE